MRLNETLHFEAASDEVKRVFRGVSHKMLLGPKARLYKWTSNTRIGGHRLDPGGRSWTRPAAMELSRRDSERQMSVPRG
jgi:hypothetical protein